MIYFLQIFITLFILIYVISIIERLLKRFGMPNIFQWLKRK